MGDKTDFMIKLLNHCFDDIERFIVRLQVSADAYRDLGRREGSRGEVDSRARVPPPGEFMDTFAKFKLAFNLLGELKSVVRDPNAPELVHFLFTPLALVVAASKDPSSGASDLAAKVVSPLLTVRARELLKHCLTLKEADLWNSLGPAWTQVAGEYRGENRPYYPVFRDGWEPASYELDDIYAYHPPSRPVSQYGSGERFSGDFRTSPREIKPYPEPPAASKATVPAAVPVNVAPAREYVREYGPNNNARDYSNFEEEQQKYSDRILKRGGKCYEARFDRVGTNERELTIKRGEAVDVLDDGKNWWRVRNAVGEEGYVPYTHLKPWEVTGPPILIDDVQQGIDYPIARPYYDSYGGDPYFYDPYGYDDYYGGYGGYGYGGYGGYSGYGGYGGYSRHGGYSGYGRHGNFRRGGGSFF